jgi:peptidyl-tRNA hydrolase, PTH1 family
VKLIVGLGNPGPDYERTRHNAGFRVLDLLAQKLAPSAIARQKFHAMTIETEIAGERTMLLKPTTFMNRSGQCVGEAVRFYKADPSADLLVVTDERALPCGVIRLRATGGTGGHNGLGDIERALGTRDYCRLRIGIDEPPPPIGQTDWVLGRFTEEQEERLKPALAKAVEACESFVRRGITLTMNDFNYRPDTGATSAEGIDPGWLGDTEQNA